MTDGYALLPERVWDGYASHSRAGSAVVVEGGRIAAVVERAAVPDGLPRVELPGCTLLPGLIDAHVHLADWMLPAFLAAGVTTVRDVGNDLSFILELRARVRAAPDSGPDVLCCGPVLDGSVVNWPLFGRRHTGCQALATSVAELSAAGVDAIKLYVNLDEEQIGAAVRAAHERGLFVLAHLGTVGAERAVAAGIDEIEHLSGCTAAWRFSDQERLDDLSDLLEAGRTVVCPTLVVWDRLGRAYEPAFTHDRRLAWVPPVLLEAWERNAYRFRGPEARLALQRSVVEMKRCLGRLSERGVTIVAGSDTPWPYLVPGFSLHDELALMVDAGLAPVDALRAATSRAAQVLGVAEVTGGVRPGRRADLLIVRGDPTVDISSISHVEQVVRCGVPLDSEDLRRTALERHHDARAAPVVRSITAWAGGRGVWPPPVSTSGSPRSR